MLESILQLIEIRIRNEKLRDKIYNLQTNSFGTVIIGKTPRGTHPNKTITIAD